MNLTHKIIFIDEIDSILKARCDEEQECSRRLKNEFFVQLDGLLSEQNSRIVLIGATNRPYELDTAALRRFVARPFHR